MDEMFAKNFDIVSDYNVIGGQTLYTIDLTGEDGMVSVYGIKKETCHIENESKEGAEQHLAEILAFTRNDRMIERKLYQELKGYEIEYDELGDEVSRYTEKGREGQFRVLFGEHEGEYEPRYKDDKLVLRIGKEGEILPKYDFEGMVIPDEERPEAMAYLAEQERLRLEAEAEAMEAEAEAESEDADTEEETGGD